MSARRSSGNVRVSVRVDDSIGAYRCRVSAPGELAHNVLVVPPLATLALITIDSTAAFDDAARAAIAFTIDEGLGACPNYETVDGADRVALVRR